MLIAEIAGGQPGARVTDFGLDGMSPEDLAGEADLDSGGVTPRAGGGGISAALKL